MSKSANPGLWKSLELATIPGLGRTGTMLRDQSGHGRLGTTTADGWAISNGGIVSDYADAETTDIIASQNPLNGLTHASISLWFSTSDITSYGRLLSNGGADDLEIVVNFTGAGIGAIQNNGLGYFIRNTTASWVGAGAIVAGQWHYVCMLLGDNIQTYIDGLLTDTEETAWSNGVDGNMKLMGRFATGNLVEGMLGPVYVHGRRISAQEIALLNSDPMAPFRRKPMLIGA